MQPRQRQLLKQLVLSEWRRHFHDAAGGNFIHLFMPTLFGAVGYLFILALHSDDPPTAFGKCAFFSAATAFLYVGNRVADWRSVTHPREEIALRVPLLQQYRALRLPRHLVFLSLLLSYFPLLLLHGWLMGVLVWFVAAESVTAALTLLALWLLLIGVMINSSILLGAWLSKHWLNALKFIAWFVLPFLIPLRWRLLDGVIAGLCGVIIGWIAWRVFAAL